MELELRPLALPGIPQERPIVIAGPCSAETEEQVMSTATSLANRGIKIFAHYRVFNQYTTYFLIAPIYIVRPLDHGGNIMTVQIVTYSEGRNLANSKLVICLNPFHRALVQFKDYTEGQVCSRFT